LRLAEKFGDSTNDVGKIAFKVFKPNEHLRYKIVLDYVVKYNEIVVAVEQTVKISRCIKLTKFDRQSYQIVFLCKYY
jgi:hypothetical protein